MRVLMTGGAGFIGSNFIRLFLESHPEHQVTNLDKLTCAGNLENLAGRAALDNYRFIKGDICDPGLVRRLMAETDAKEAHLVTVAAIQRQQRRPVARPAAGTQSGNGGAVHAPGRGRLLRPLAAAIRAVRPAGRRPGGGR